MFLESSKDLVRFLIGPGADEEAPVLPGQLADVLAEFSSLEEEKKRSEAELHHRQGWLNLRYFQQDKLSGINELKYGN